MTDPKPLMTGSEVHIVFTHDDGTTCKIGTWNVPHDTSYEKMERVGADLGWTIVHQMAKQPEKTIVACSVVHGPVPFDDEY